MTMASIHKQILVLFLITPFTSSANEHDYRYDCSGLQVVKRREWGSFTHLPKNRFENAAARIFIHQTATAPCHTFEQCKSKVRQIQENDIKVLEHQDISFHFLIGGDGRAYEGLGWDTAGDHTTYYPYTIGIAFIGQFDKNRPTDAAWRALSSLLQCGVRHHKLQMPYSIHSHREVSCTSCPGDSLHRRLRSLKAYNLFPLPYTEMCDQKYRN